MRNTLVVSLLFGLGLCLTSALVRADDAEDKTAEDTAIVAIKKLGGTITRDENATRKPVVGVSFKHTRITNDGLKELKAHKHLRSLKNPRER